MRDIRWKDISGWMLSSPLRWVTCDDGREDPPTQTIFTSPRTTLPSQASQLVLCFTLGYCQFCQPPLTVFEFLDMCTKSVKITKSLFTPSSGVLLQCTQEGSTQCMSRPPASIVVRAQGMCAPLLVLAVRSWKVSESNGSKSLVANCTDQMEYVEQLDTIKPEPFHFHSPAPWTRHTQSFVCNRCMTKWPLICLFCSSCYGHSSSKLAIIAIFCSTLLFW